MHLAKLCHRIVRVAVAYIVVLRQNIPVHFVIKLLPLFQRIIFRLTNAKLCPELLHLNQKLRCFLKINAKRGGDCLFPDDSMNPLHCKSVPLL